MQGAQNEAFRQVGNTMINKRIIEHILKTRVHERLGIKPSDRADLVRSLNDSNEYILAKQIEGMSCDEVLALVVFSVAQIEGQYGGKIN